MVTGGIACLSSADGYFHWFLPVKNGVAAGEKRGDGGRIRIGMKDYIVPKK